MHEAGFQCAGGVEWVETTVDESGGSRQQHVEDSGGLRAECADGAVGCFGGGLYDLGGAGELGSADGDFALELFEAQGLESGAGRECELDWAWRAGGGHGYFYP